MTLFSLIPDRRTESETARDGLLSTRREIHASVVGAAVGVVGAASGSVELLALFTLATLGAKLGSRHLGDIRKEPWYALGAMLLGLVVGGAI